MQCDCIGLFRAFSQSLSRRLDMVADRRHSLPYRWRYGSFRPINSLLASIRHGGGCIAHEICGPVALSNSFVFTNIDGSGYHDSIGGLCHQAHDTG